MALLRGSGALYGPMSLSAPRSVQGGQAPARRDGQALALAPFGLVRERMHLVQRLRQRLKTGPEVSLPVGWRCTK
ncbi:hypothetical protein ATO2_09305 [Roseovarius sp. 22II1-1F6A]|nr:hypothetical protein ATO2_09305 [Roseovarius sp. 22II1-1F6A]